MKILAQNYSDGKLALLEAPDPIGKPGMLIIGTRASLVSVGTEKAMIDVAQKSMLGKALARPDWVKQVIDKVKTEGPMEAWRQSKARLEMPIPLGYSSAGVVIENGGGRGHSLKIGDRVACTGSGYASHADIVIVPPNLCAKIPDNVSFEDASYVALGGIAMEAVRMAGVEFGHKVAVIGLGLLGQLTIQILAAAGCHVFGIDISEEKCDLAKLRGAEEIAVSGRNNVIQAVLDFTGGQGADSVIVMASAKSNEPLENAASMCRERGKVVATGLIGLDIPRKAFFEKELELCVSRAWGPGALDPDYDERNLQWPLAYVRWTAQRNLEEFLRMLSLGRVRVDHLTTHRFTFENALDAYELILSGKEPAIGVVLQYPELKTKTEATSHKICISSSDRKAITGDIGIGLIGAGLFARGTLLPAMKGIYGLRMEGVATAGGLSSRHIADSFKFRYATTQYQELLADPNIDLVFILTRHGSHAHFVCEALKAGKAVFVEKPLAIDSKGLEEIERTYLELQKRTGEGYSKPPFVMVGFNRRFAPGTLKAIEFIGDKGPSTIVHMRCNAGFIPANSWVHHPEEGGGRIIGEVCHFIDLAQALTGGLPKTIFAACAESSQGTRDNVCVTVQMDNGAAATITYAANGDKAFPREDVQIFSGGSVCIINNFKNINFTVNGRSKRSKSLEVDRGHKNELKAAFNSIRTGKPSPISFKSLVATTRATFAAEESILKGVAVSI